MTEAAVATMENLPGLMELELLFEESQRWSEDSWRDEVAAANRLVLVCQGSGGLAAAATFALSDGVVDLHRIMTAASARRRGFARHLMGAGLEWAREAGAARMLLEVEASNVAALSLYDAMGFHRISERHDYYGPEAHAVILEREIQAVEGDEPS